MEITKDEYMALIQSEAGRQDLEAEEQQGRAIRFQQRLYNVATEASVTNKGYNDIINEMRNVTPEAYEFNRRNQMVQLYNAYMIGDRRTQLWIEPNKTDYSSVRRVVGHRPGGEYYNGAMYLDPETIRAVQAYAEFARNDNTFSHGGWQNNCSVISLCNTIDEIIACKGILEKSTQDTSITYGKIVNETDIVKRAIGKNIMGRNNFGINDYEVTTKDIIGKHKGIPKLFNKMLQGFSNLLNTNEEIDKIGQENIDVAFRDDAEEQELE